MDSEQTRFLQNLGRAVAPDGPKRVGENFVALSQPLPSQGRRAWSLFSHGINNVWQPTRGMWLLVGWTG